MNKVAIFIISLRGGGAERIVSYLLNEGFKKFEFHLILLRKEIDYLLPQTDNIKVVELGGEGRSKIMNLLRIPILARKLKKYLEVNNIKTILSLLERANIIACYAKKIGWRGKLIISERADTITYYHSVPFGLLMIGLVKKYYRLADIVTVISKGIACSLKALGIGDCKVIYNPVNLSPDSYSEKPAGDPFTFISIGRLEPQKNQALLLRAFAGLDNKTCRLVVIGKGPLLGRLKRMSAALGIHDRVSFMGFQPDVKSWLERSDCLVLSSDYEGFGNVIVEALNSSVAVISTDCHYGPREILAPDTDIDTVIKDNIEMARYGILTPVKNIACMTHAMMLMMTNNDIMNKYRKLGSLRAADFGINKIMRQYFGLF
jgi:N-acetylgalactosamine-N,N'-diacetylbacillosaminyl-diphospho-undecaprenol 4-alpha-N-acetylgalactosaminyltransferase